MNSGIPISYKVILFKSIIDYDYNLRGSQFILQQSVKFASLTRTFLKRMDHEEAQASKALGETREYCCSYKKPFDAIPTRFGPVTVYISRS